MFYLIVVFSHTDSFLSDLLISTPNYHDGCNKNSKPMITEWFRCFFWLALLQPIVISIGDQHCDTPHVLKSILPILVKGFEVWVTTSLTAGMWVWVDSGLLMLWL